MSTSERVADDTSRVASLDMRSFDDADDEFEDLNIDDPEDFMNAIVSVSPTVDLAKEQDVGKLSDVEYVADNISVLNIFEQSQRDIIMQSVSLEKDLLHVSNVLRFNRIKFVAEELTRLFNINLKPITYTKKRNSFNELIGMTKSDPQIMQKAKEIHEALISQFGSKGKNFNAQKLCLCYLASSEFSVFKMFPSSKVTICG